jgi:hypothetical protein
MRDKDLEAIWKHHIGNEDNQTKYRDLLVKVMDE